MRKSILFSLIFTILIQLSYSQVNQEWVARYNGPGNGGDGASTLAIDGSGNVYVTGFSGVYPNTDYITIKYNSSGDSLWVARYNGPDNSYDNAFSIAVDASGNVYVTGNSIGNSSTDYATVKYNASGVQQWVARYNGNSSDNATAITVDGAGNVYVTGHSRGSGTNVDYATIKYNSSGDSLWVARYNGPINSADQAYSIAVDSFGNVYVTGYSFGSGTFVDYATVKYNSSGVQQWAARYNGPGNASDYAWSLKVDNLGNVYVTGESDDLNGKSDYATIKYNSSGVQQWVQRYHGPAVDSNSTNIAWSLAVDGSLNVYVTGMSAGIGTGHDYATIKYNSSGTQLWVARYNGPSNGSDDARVIAVDSSGNIYVTGESFGGMTSSDYLTIKYNSSGVQQWFQRYNGPGNIGDQANSIAVDNSGNVYVTGRSLGNGTGIDYATIKYSQLVNIQPISNEVPNQFLMYQNYPNPFNPITNIKFQIPYKEFVKLTVFDALGKEITTLVNEQLKEGVYEIEWNAEDNPSGIYYYRLFAGNFIQTNKMVLIK